MPSPTGLAADCFAINSKLISSSRQVEWRCALEGTVTFSTPSIKMSRNGLLISLLGQGDTAVEAAAFAHQVLAFFVLILFFMMCGSDDQGATGNTWSGNAWDDWLKPVAEPQGKDLSARAAGGFVSARAGHDLWSVVPQIVLPSCLDESHLPPEGPQKFSNRYPYSPKTCRQNDALSSSCWWRCLPLAAGDQESSAQ